MADGAVKFVTDSIDAEAAAFPGRDWTATGATFPGLSSSGIREVQYGIWGRLGTRASQRDGLGEFLEDSRCIVRLES